MNLIRPIVIIAFLAALALPGFALAQGSCAEGMTNDYFHLDAEPIPQADKPDF